MSVCVWMFIVWNCLTIIVRGTNQLEFDFGTCKICSLWRVEGFILLLDINNINRFVSSDIVVKT